MITPREKQLLLSMIEQLYESGHHTSFMATVHSLSPDLDSDDEELFRKLKREKGCDPNGRISRVVTNRVYNSYEQSEDDLCELLGNVCSELELDPRHVSDDMLCRTL